MLKAGGEVIVSDYVYPTVLSCTDEGLAPIVERTGKGVDGADSRYISSVYHISDPYIIFRSLKVAGEHDIDRYEFSDVRDFIYDRRTNTLMEGYIYNRDMDVRGACSLESWGHDLPKNVIVQTLGADFLQSLNDRGRLSGPLKALADTIDTDANDILMIATLNN